MNESEIVEPSDAPVLWNGEYLKIFYNVHLPSGEIVKCWPNAGYMNAGDGSGRMWRPEDKVLVSVADNEEFKSEVMWQTKQAARLALAMDLEPDEAVALFQVAGARRLDPAIDKLAMATLDPKTFEPRPYPAMQGVPAFSLIASTSRWAQSKRDKHARYLAKKRKKR